MHVRRRSDLARGTRARNGWKKSSLTEGVAVRAALGAYEGDADVGHVTRGYRDGEGYSSAVVPIFRRQGKSRTGEARE